MLTRRNQLGLTLIEMLVALTVNIVALLALVGIFASNLSHYNKVIASDRLNQQLQTALMMMVKDIRRAGYWPNAYLDINTGANTNPFMQSAADITAPSTSCLLFTYDNNENLTLPAISSAYDDERYGYRLNNQILQFRPSGAPFDCNASSNTWENVTDPQTIQVTNLSFGLTQQSVPIGNTTNRMLIRGVDISITARLTSDATVTKTMTQHVRIRNDKFVP